jgi:hypothetical protein
MGKGGNAPESGEVALIGIVTSFYLIQLPNIIEFIKINFGNLIGEYTLVLPVTVSYLIGGIWAICVVMSLYFSKSANINENKKKNLRKYYSMLYNWNIKFITPVLAGFILSAYFFNSVFSFALLNPLITTLSIFALVIIIIILIIQYFRRGRGKYI